MGGMRVAQIQVNSSDSAGTTVLTIYAKLDPHYAVYRTSERVMVHFADDVEEDRSQRILLSAINPVRGQINGLIDGWRVSKAPEKESKARLFDRRVADGLVVALQGDVPSATQLLTATKDDLVAERTSWARFEYLLFASAAALSAIAVCSFVTSPWFAGAIYAFDRQVADLWHAAAAGTVGSLRTFSHATIAPTPSCVS
jgi:hypothetical protein